MKDTWGGLHSDWLGPGSPTESSYQVVIRMYNAIGQETRKAIKHIDEGALKKKIQIHKQTIIHREMLTTFKTPASIICLVVCVLHV